MMQKQKSLHL